MAMIDFSPLQQIDPAGAFFRGQEAAQAQTERNMLRQQQMMQMEAQRENMLAQRDQRAAAALKAQQDAATQSAITNALASGDTAALNKLGMPGLEAASKLGAVQKAGSEAVTQKLTQSRTLLDTIDPSDPNAPQQFMAWHEANHTDPVLGPVLQRMGVTAEQSRARIAQAAAQGPEAIANLIAQSREGQAKFAERFKPMVVAPGASVYQPGSATAMFTAPAAPVKPTPAETEEIVTRLQDPTLTPAARKRLEARLDILTVREPKEPREPKDDPRTVVAFRETDAAGNVTLLNKFGQVITPTAPVKGKPSATFEKTTAQRKQLSVDLDRAIIELTEAAKPGGLIDRSTGSGAGQLRDIAMGFGGVASSGAIAGSELAPISDLVLKMVPRFEGPQSNKDTTSYERAAGQLANTALPTAQRKAAADVLIRLMKERKGQFVSAAMAAEGTGAAPASDLAAERENARSAIAAGAPEAAVRKRFKEKTGQEL